MKFSAQIRAARACLNWSQEDLARESDLSLSGIQNIERDQTTPTVRTQNKLKLTLKKHGYKLTSAGIEHEEYPIYFTEGKTHEEAYLELLKDAHDHLLTIKNPELLIMYADDRVSPPSVNNSYRKMRKDGIKMRQLIQEGNNYIIGPLDEYRYIPKKLFINRVTLIYGDRIANETADVLKGVIKIDPINTEIQRNMFNILWDTLSAPTNTCAEERFE